MSGENSKKVIGVSNATPAGLIAPTAQAGSTAQASLAGFTTPTGSIAPATHPDHPTQASATTHADPTTHASPDRPHRAALLADKSYRVALLCGGISNEREVSLASAAAVEKALVQAGHQVTRIDPAKKDFLARLTHFNPHVAFIALHGKGGEDGTIQGALELMGIPYTGSGPLGSALAMDKHRTKLMYQAHGLLTPSAFVIKKGEKDGLVAHLKQRVETMGLPLVVKPTDDGSSVGISLVNGLSELMPALENALAAGSDVLVERFVAGVEITIPVIGGAKPYALPSIEIIPQGKFYDYESKYTQGGSAHILPARISAQAQQAAERAAIVAHEALGCYGVSRTDFIVDKDDKVWVIETNTIPGMTSTSLLPDAAAHAGIEAGELYELLISWALERTEHVKLAECTGSTERTERIERTGQP